MNERPAIKANIGTLQQIFGGQLRSVTFDVELKSSGGAADAPPEIGAALQGCGFGETINVATDVTYEPVSASLKSVTIYYFQDGIRYILVGCVGNVSFNLEAGAVGKASFTFTGHLTGPTDETLADPTYASNVPAALINVPFAIGGFSAIISSFAFDMSNTIGMPADISATDGYSQLRITRRDVNGSYDPEATLIAADNPQQDLQQGNAQALTTGVIGTGTGGKYQIDMPLVYYRDVSPGDREGIRTYDVPFGAVEDTGDDDVSIVFN